MESIWNDVKKYFGDGYIPNSSPLRFNVHSCTLPLTTTKNEAMFYGIDIDETTISLFTTMGDVTQPPCTCDEMPSLCAYLDETIRTSPDAHAGDYSLHTGKPDTSLTATYLYTMRDTLQWWAHWHGLLDGPAPGHTHYWKLVYVNFATIPDDVQIPPADLVSGAFRLLGHTHADLLAGLRAEGVAAADVEYMDMCLRRQYVLQYLEKREGAALQARLRGKTALMTQFRNITANTHGVAVGVRAAAATVGANAPSTDDVRADPAVEMAAIGCALSMDIAKEALGVLAGEPTETVAIPEPSSTGPAHDDDYDDDDPRSRLQRELRWTYVRSVSFLDAHAGTAPLLKRFATSGLHFVFLMDRYRERVHDGGVRFPVRGALAERVRAYVGPHGAEEVEEVLRGMAKEDDEEDLGKGLGKGR